MVRLEADHLAPPERLDDLGRQVPEVRRDAHPPPVPVEKTKQTASSDKVIYLAYVDGQIAGQIRVSRYWNRYAYIEDIVVDPPFRKQGVGQALLERAIAWAKGGGFPGIMLKTQNNNVAACRLYERTGMKLGGFDKYLYKGITPDTEEIALYWYLIF